MEVLLSWLAIVDNGSRAGVRWPELEFVALRHGEPRSLQDVVGLGGLEVVISDGLRRYELWVEDCYQIDGHWRSAGELLWRGPVDQPVGTETPLNERNSASVPAI